jgi:mannan endo-1,4-beta-mannosidase
MKAAYKAWVSYLLNRVNTVSGVRYGDDPAIMAWELGNELGCSTNGTIVSNRSACSSKEQIEPWIVEMSAYVRSLDSNHLIGPGGIGMMSRPLDPAIGPRFSDSRFADFEATIKMPDIDFGTYHMYPYEGAAPSTTLSREDWAKRAISEYENVAKTAGKPTIFEEFGDTEANRLPSSIDLWLQALESAGGSAFLNYQLGVTKIWCTDPACYGSYDVFPSAAGYATLKSWAERFKARIN